jgi:hypothetical protein
MFAPENGAEIASSLAVVWGSDDRGRLGMAGCKIVEWRETLTLDRYLSAAGCWGR